MGSGDRSQRARDAVGNLESGGERLLRTGPALRDGKLECCHLRQFKERGRGGRPLASGCCRRAHCSNQKRDYAQAGKVPDRHPLSLRSHAGERSLHGHGEQGRYRGSSKTTRLLMSEMLVPKLKAAMDPASPGPRGSEQVAHRLEDLRQLFGRSASGVSRHGPHRRRHCGLLPAKARTRERRHHPPGFPCVCGRLSPALAEIHRLHRQTRLRTHHRRARQSAERSKRYYGRAKLHRGVDGESAGGQEGRQIHGRFAADHYAAFAAIAPAGWVHGTTSAEALQRGVNGNIHDMYDRVEKVAFSGIEPA